MATSYSVLVSASTVNGSLASWINHAAIQSAAPFIILEAESFIYRRLRVWQMLTSTIGTMNQADVGITLPTDYIEDKKLMITGVNKARIVRKPMQEVLDSWTYDGSGVRIQQQPNIFFNDNANIVFDSAVDQSYPWLLYYYQNPVALVTAGTNFLTNTYPRLLRCAMMIGASEFMKDAGVGSYDRTYWIEEAEKEIAIAQMESDRSEHTMESGFIQI